MSELYRQISIRMWGDERFRHLSPPAPCGRFLWFYLITGPHTINIPGVVPVAPAVIGAALGWKPEAFRDAFREVIREGMAKADEEAGLIWLPNAMKHNRPQSPNCVKAWAKTWPLVPECALKAEIWCELKAFVEGMGDAFRDAFREGCRQPSRNQEQEQEQDQDPESRPGGGARDLLGEVDSSKPKPKRPGKKDGLLATYREPAARLWEYQEQLRVAAVPRTRRRAPTDADLIEVAEVLALGHSEDDCRHVLRVYAAEARRNPESARWFNGETNWVPANFRRNLGQSDPGEPSGSGKSVTQQIADASGGLVS